MRAAYAQLEELGADAVFGSVRQAVAPGTAPGTHGEATTTVEGAATGETVERGADVAEGAGGVARVEEAWVEATAAGTAGAMVAVAKEVVVKAVVGLVAARAEAAWEAARVAGTEGVAARAVAARVVEARVAEMAAAAKGVAADEG